MSVTGTVLRIDRDEAVVHAIIDPFDPGYPPEPVIVPYLGEPPPLLCPAIFSDDLRWCEGAQVESRTVFVEEFLTMPGFPAEAQTFTPTLSGGWALGNSTYDAYYVRVGDWVMFNVSIVLGSTATKGTTMFAALPVTAASAEEASSGCIAWYSDTGTAFYTGFVRPGGTGTILLQVAVASGTYASAGNITATNPHTWATGDIIHYSGQYRAA